MSEINEKQKAAVLRLLSDTLQDLSGLAPEDIDPDATFLELGFDSLFLTQLAQAFKKNTKVDIAFRQLMTEAPTLENLAEYVFDRNPQVVQVETGNAEPVTGVPIEQGIPTSLAIETAAQPVTASIQASPSITWAPPPTVILPDEGNVSGTAFEAIVTEQLRVMERQLNVLATVRTAIQTTSQSEQPAIKNDLTGANPGNSGVTASAPGAGSADASGDEVTSESATEAPRRSGPWRPANTAGASEMTATQADALDRLIGRYTSRTQKSKTYTQEHRAHFADARAVSGFQRDWKEMVYPIVAERSSGSKIWDTDGNEYVDMTMGFGSVLFGHSPEFITNALRKQLDQGVEIGPQSGLAGEVARQIAQMSGVERVSFCNTGSEAVLVAMRLARTVTGRDKIAVFEGDYHGVFDEVLVRSGRDNKAMPMAPGIPRSSVGNVIVFDRHDPELVEKIRKHSDDLAAVLIEPVSSRNPDDQSPELLKKLRDVSDDLNVPLIFDEIITGFRLNKRGVRGEFGVEADIVTFGKVLGGGMPIGVVAGKSEYLDGLDGGAWQFGDDSFPLKGMTFFAGTFVRHPLAMAAASAVLNELAKRGPSFYTELNAKTEKFANRLNAMFSASGAPVVMERFGSLLHLTFTKRSRFDGLFHYFLRASGVHIWDGRPTFVSDAHTVRDLDTVFNAFELGVKEMQDGEFWILTDPEGTKLSEDDQETGPADPLSIPVKDKFRLTPGQHEIWLASRLSADASRGFNAGFQFRFTGDLDLDALRSALQQVVSRHDGLRTVIDSEGRHQAVLPSLEIEVPFDDLSKAEEGPVQSRIEELLENEAQHQFDLTNGPLFRFRIIRVGPREHILSVCAHHIIFDGWAHHVFQIEIAEIYSALVEGRKPDLSEIAQMSQYAGWLESFEGSPSGKTSQKYWIDRFNEPPAPLELPAKQPRTKLTGHTSAQRRTVIEADLVARIKKVGARNGSTGFGLFLAAYKLLLHQLTGKRDVTVGIAMSGQSMSGIEKVIGHCVNFLPIRSTVSDMPFGEYLKTVSNALLDAHDNQGYTLGQLMKHLSSNSGKPPTTIVSALFNLDRALGGVEFSGVTHELSALPTSNFNHELFFDLVERADGMLLICEYSSDLFDEATIDSWMATYRDLLVRIAEDPTLPTSQFRSATESDDSRPEPTNLSEIRSRVEIRAN